MKQFMIKNGLVVAGGAIQGLGMGLFLFPHFIPSGGAGGIAVLLNYWFNMDMGIGLWIVNFSMLLLAVTYLGKRVTLWTIIGITVTSISIQLFEQIHIPNRNIFYDLVFGSVLLGTGIGLLMRQGVSNGGVGVIALIIASGKNISPGQPLFWINCCIFLITAVIIDWKIILLALTSQWISTRIIDLICQVTFHQSYTLGWRKKP
ncbi:YitT family protein [Virgibacillus sp. C22-A2]|uniref:YitT family protein n=1 Tax=Virgibacillus tibetensis TaxID=3042313 RepID=A0ABU6KMY1_9BACI|nr:YitT family protein [Virgibacillus sp. C22-A2]